MASRRSGALQVWKIPAEGGQPIPLTRDGGSRSHADEEGELVYYYKRPGESASHIWSVPVDGGEERPVLEKRLANGYQWCLWKGHIVYMTQEGDEVPSIEMYDLTTRETTRLFSFARDALISQAEPIWDGITVSPDGQWILYTELDVSSDLTLVENFR